MDLASRLDDALTRRLYPHTGLSPKQLAFALGVSDDTLWRYRTGRTSMPANALLALFGFFRARGDTAFECELLVDAHEEADRQRLAADTAQPWLVRRLPLDSLRHPTALRLRRVAAVERDLLTAAESAGLLRDCSVFRRTGKEVILIWAGTSAGVRPSIRDTMLGKPPEAWPDFRFARLVREHVLEVQPGAPTYYYMDGCVHGIRAPYRRSAFASGDIVMTLTERLPA
jgi:hypothetical protein